jgi:fructose-1,6-bisphosphatase
MGKKKKLLSEQETIKIILNLARQQGCEDKVRRLIEKFQQAVKGAQTPFERQQIASLGIAEIHKTIGCVGGLVVDGVQILPPETAYQEAINLHKGLVRMD